MNAITGNHVLLRAGALRLVLPQSDVGDAEYLAARPSASDTPGLLRSGDSGDERFHAALSDDMTLLAECPTERFVACPIAGTTEQLVWCWDELRVLIDVELDPIEIPASITTPTTPVSAYVELDGAPAFICSGRDLVVFALRALEHSDAA